MEPPSGDTQRWIVAGLGMAAEDPYIESPHFYQINRGKRSVCLDLKSEEGMASLETLLGEADVFLSNMRYNSLKSLNLGAEELLERHPHLIVCPMTGWGMEGPESDKPVYDVAGFWARSSAASSHTPRGEYPPILVPGFGDVTTALSAVGGICAAGFLYFDGWLFLRGSECARSSIGSADDTAEPTGHSLSPAHTNTVTWA